MKSESHKIGGRPNFSMVMQWVGCLYEGKKTMLPQKFINIHPIKYPRVRCDNVGCLSPQRCPELLS